MWRLLKLCAAIMITAGMPLAAQVVISNQVNYQGTSVPFAAVRVCVVTSTGTPCNPTAQLYADYNLTIPVSNPAAADQFGNYTYYAVNLMPPSFYTVQVTPIVGTTWSYVVSGNGSGSGCTAANILANGCTGATNQTGAFNNIVAPGGTMTGLLTLAGNPSTALQAVPKQYVDGNFCPLAGPLCTFTGSIIGPSISTAFQPVINVLFYGADGTLAQSNTGSYIQNSTTITVPGANFTSANIGWGVTLFDSTAFGSPYGSPTAISATACSYPAAPVFPATTAPVTITAANSFRSTEHILITGATSNCTALNGRIFTVDNGNLSGSSFQANISDLVTFGGADSFTGTRTMDQIGTITAVTDTTHAVVSVAPTLTVTNPKVGWWPDLTVPIQNALNAGNNLTYFAGGTVGAKVPQLLFGNGEFHVTSALYQQHVQVQGIPGAGGTRIVWDGANHGTIPVEPVNAPTYPGIAHVYGTMWDRQSIGPGNSALKGIELYYDSPFFVPDYTIEWDQKVDHSTFVNEVHTFGSLVANMAVGVPLANGQTIGGVTANLHWLLNRWDEVCGDGVYIYIPPGSARMSMGVDYSTLDTGSKLEVAQNCKFRSVLAVDTGDLTSTANPGIISASHMRVESQTATQFSTTDGPAAWFRFVNQNKGTFSYVTPFFDLTDITINNLSSQNSYILGSGNTNGFFCPHGTVTNPAWGAGMAGLIGTSTTPANYACGNSAPLAASPINQTGAFAANAFGWIGTFPIGSKDPSTAAWVGSLPHNKMPNTGFAQGAVDYTLGTGVTVATTGCDGIGNPCLSITGTGSAFAGGTTTNVTTAIPVTAGKVYTFGATLDCTNITSGIISMYATDGVTTVFANCPGPGSPPNVFTQTYAPTTSTITVGFSLRASTATNGQVVTFSAPFLYAGATAVPYQPNPSLMDATIPAAALPVATTGAQGIMQVGGGLSVASGTVSLAGWQMLTGAGCRSTAGPQSTSANTTTALAICPLPANTLTANSQVRIHADWNIPNTGTSCVWAVRLTTSSAGISAGTSVAGTVTVNHNGQLFSTIAANNSTTSETISANWLAATNLNAGGAQGAASANLTAQQYISLTAQATAGTETCTLSDWYVEYLP